MIFKCSMSFAINYFRFTNLLIFIQEMNYMPIFYVLIFPN